MIKNFTVIGNLLIVHIEYYKEATISTKLAEIPPEIFNRLLFYSNMGIICYKKLNEDSFNVKLKVINEGNRYYLSNNQELIRKNGRIIYCIYLLKDV